jgi:hypothetical protein
MDNDKIYYTNPREEYRPNSKVSEDILPEWIENLKKYFDKTAEDDPSSIH